MNASTHRSTITFMVRQPERDPSPIRAFEETFEPLGLTALAIEVVTGLWMGWIGMLVGTKLRDDNLSGLAGHIRGITALAIAFVVVEALIRLADAGPRLAPDQPWRHHPAP